LPLKPSEFKVYCGYLAVADIAVDESSKGGQNIAMSKKRKECVEFGRRIRYLRGRKGLSQEAFADEAGLDRAHMGRIERGERSPSLTLIYRICLALRLPPKKLLGYTLLDLEEFLGKNP